jgi:DNA-binding LacI/PurR family transcriptional regulator/DNA-binding transcriptional regulator YhcF (GntR family)
MAATLQDLAQRLHNDIAQRQLVPGSRYLTAEESARVLGTSIATANRVLRLLAEKDIVIRRRNSGTFVGPAVLAPSTGEVQTASILIPAPTEMRQDGATRVDLVIEGILSNHPDVADVRVSYVPAVGSVEFVRGLLESLLDSGRLAGVIAVSCPREVYRFLGENRYPLVVMGSLYPDQPYPSVDTDERQAGQQLIEYLIEKGHRRMGLFSNSESCPGDNHFRDGVSEAITAGKLPHNALVWRAPGQDPAVMDAQVKEMMSMPDRPTAIVTKLPKWAGSVANSVRQLGLRVPEDVEIVFKGFASEDSGNSVFAHAQPAISYREITEIAGRMLADVRKHQTPTERARVIPYQMRVPSGVSTSN